MNYYAFSALVNFISGLLAGIFVYFYNRKSRINRSFALFSFLIAAWSFGYFFWQISNTSDSALFWSRALMVGAVFAAPAYLSLALALTDLYERKKIILIASYLIFSVFFFLNFTPLFVNHVEPIAGFPFWPMPGPAYHFFLALFFGYFFYSTYLLIQKYRISKGVIREQIKFVLIGISVVILGGSTNYFLWYKIPIPPVTNIAATLYLIIIAYAIVRYRLMDVRIVSRKIVINIGSAFFAYGLFYLIVWGYSTFLGGFYTRNAIIAGLVIIPVAVFVVFEFDKLITRFANVYLFLTLYNFQETINSLTLELTNYNDLEKISSLIVDTVKKSMQLDRAGVILLDDNKPNQFEFTKMSGYEEIQLKQCGLMVEHLQINQKPLVRDEIFLPQQENINGNPNKLKELHDYMEKIDAALCLPLLSDGKIIGMIILGSKISGDAYSKDDIGMLFTLSVRASTAIDNARLYGKLRDFGNVLKVKVGEQTTSLKITNAALEEKSKILADKLLELEKMNSYMVGREVKMQELKNRISELEGKLPAGGLAN